MARGGRDGYGMSGREVIFQRAHLRCKNETMKEFISWQYKKIYIFSLKKEEDICFENSKVISTATTITIIKKFQSPLLSKSTTEGHPL
jgi:hypothetical protein